MTKTFFTALLLFTIPGCLSSQESALRDGIRTLNAVADLLHSVANGESIKEAQPKLKALIVHFRGLKYRLDRPEKPSFDRKEDLTAKYYEEYQDAKSRFRNALAKAASIPEAARMISQVFDEEMPGFPER